jgi:hypothetical protein
LPQPEHIPVVLDGVVSAERLQQLLNVGHERPELDYKEECDPSSTRDLVELAKDIGAMMMGGGYIVIGADSQGRASTRAWPSGRGLYDESRLCAKLRKYFGRRPTVSLAEHDLDRHYALIWIAPHPDGYAMFAADGQYERNGETVKVFSRGEVYHRSGTSSERLSPEGFKELIAAITKREREAARAEFQNTLGAAMADLQASYRGLSDSLAPTGALSLDLPLDRLGRAVLELLRREDRVAIAHLLRSSIRQAEEVLARGQSIEDCLPILDRIVTVVGEAVVVRAPRQAEHRFHTKPNTDSTPSRTAIPQQAEHRFHAKPNTQRPRRVARPGFHVG